MDSQNWKNRVLLRFDIGVWLLVILGALFAFVSVTTPYITPGWH